MNRFSGIAVVAAFSVAAATHAEEANAPAADVRVAALRMDDTVIGAELAIASTVLNEFAGRYETASGTALIVDCEGDLLTIELPNSSQQLRLRALSRSDFFVAEIGARIAFQVDEDGYVSALLLYPQSGEQPIVATRVVGRGVVTIQDIADAPRGIVTVYDIYDGAGTLKVALSN